MIFSRELWADAGTRAFHTFWQTLGAVLTVVLGSELIPAVGIVAIDWLDALSLAAAAAALSVAKTLGVERAAQAGGAEPRRAKLD